MLTLIDADVITYEIPFVFNEEGQESEITKGIDNLIMRILEETGANEYKAYLTGKGNFREELCTRTVYKGNRKQPKPLHHQFARDYLEHEWGAVIIDGMEADDEMAIVASQNPDSTCIASRDKDLRMVECNHYSWKCGYQEEIPLFYGDYFGHLEMKGKHCKGWGMKWFYAQCLMGDKTDNILGIEGIGDAKAYKALKGCTTEKQCREVVVGMYQAKYAENAIQWLTESADLLWMVREIKDGKPVLFSHLCNWSDYLKEEAA